MEEKKWYRVVDPLNPLHDCDVLLSGQIVRNIAWADDEDEKFCRVIAMRRVDVFVGDRPFQLFAKEGEDLGLLISNACIASSPFQDEVMVTGTDRPFGLCLDESEMTREDGVMLRVARYEKAIQIALTGADGVFRATSTQTDDLREAWERLIIGMFERDDDEDDICYALRNN